MTAIAFSPDGKTLATGDITGASYRWNTPGARAAEGAMSEEGTYRQAPARLLAGRYRLMRELGRGGMGIVWLAEDQLVGRHVAVKELRAPPGLADGERELFGQRALQEARNAARVYHPGAVALHDVLPATAADDAVYLILELVEGPTLDEVIRRHGPLPDATVAAYGLQLLSVLEAAHALGVVHRDIKPGNIMIAAGDQVKLTDFGIAHTVGDTRLTRTGVLGTQAYLAPELFESIPITPPADMWSLGATLFHAIEGRGAFERDTTGATLRAILIDEVPVPRCGSGLAAAIAGMLQRDPAHRATIGQVRAALTAAAAQPGAETSGPQVTRGQATIRSRAAASPRQGPSRAAIAAAEPRWDQVPTTFARSSAAQSPRVVSASHHAGFPPDPGGKARRLVAGALLGLGTILGIVGLFPEDLPGQTLASRPYTLIPRILYIAVWATATAGVLRGGTTTRPAALLGTGFGALWFGVSVADVGEALPRHGGLRPGLVLVLLGWAIGTAGAVCGLTIRVKPAGSVPRAAIGRQGVLAVTAAIGTAATFALPSRNYTVVQNGTSHTIAVGNVFDSTWLVISGTVAIMVALVAIAIIAALAPDPDSVIMLAGAIVVMITEAAYTLILCSERISPGYFGWSPSQASRMTITASETPAFWIYCLLLTVLAVSCALMLTTRARRVTPPTPAPR